MIYWYYRWKKIQTETTNLKFRNVDHTILLDPLWANKIYLRGCQKSKDPNGEVWCIIVLLYECFLETRLFVFRSRLFLDCLHGYAVNNSYETWCNFSTMCFIVSVGVTFHDCSQFPERCFLDILQCCYIIVHSCLVSLYAGWQALSILSEWLFGVRLVLVRCVWLYGQLARDQS